MGEVTINLSNNNLGKRSTSEDGISLLVVTGVAVAGKFALGDILTFNSIADAEAKGINAAYDTTNTCMAYQHIKDFYEEAELLGVKGIKLYVQVLAKTVTMAQMVDKTSLTNAAKVLNDATVNGSVRLVGITRIPDGAYTPTYSGEFEADLATAITNAQALGVDQFEKFRPVRILLEGRNFQGSPSSARDLRDSGTGGNSNRAYVVAGSDYTVASAKAENAKYAAVGKVLGRAAAIQVQRNIGRVKDGKLSITQAGLSNGSSITSFTDANLKTLADKGYIVFRTYTGKAGFFVFDDPAACPATDDYSTLALGRVIDKAARITRSVYVEELMDDVELNPDTGKLSASTIKSYQEKVEKEINLQMTSTKEIVKVTAYVDPDQNVISTDEINIELTILPKGYSKAIIVTLGYENPLAA